MLPCLILGDSIADGTAMALRVLVGDRCEVVARNGAGTGWIASANPGGDFGTVVLSSGSNDAAVPGLADRLAALRAGVTAQTVVWILPYNRAAAEVVRALAAASGDRWVDLGGLPSRDGLHPASYVPVAQAVAPSIAVAPATPVAGTARSMATPAWVFGETAPSVVVFK